MLKVNRRELQRMSTQEIKDSLPFELTSDGEVIAAVSRVYVVNRVPFGKAAAEDDRSPMPIVRRGSLKPKGRSAHPTRATTIGQFESTANGKASENVQMARRMLPIQMSAYAVANELDAEGYPMPGYE